MLLQPAPLLFEVAPVAPFYLTRLWRVKQNRPVSSFSAGLPVIEVNRAFIRRLISEDKQVKKIDATPATSSRAQSKIAL